MTEIYCAKCKVFTGTRSETIVADAKGHRRLTGICSICKSKKNTFLSKRGGVTQKTPE